ncbi:MAG: hypothetical protein ACE5J5_07185 [Candidatus Hydrothermarchaeales archaeon]
MRKSVVIFGLILLVLISSGCIQEDLSRAGPGGCQSEEECKRYCETHEEECRSWSEQDEGGILQRFQGDRSKDSKSQEKVGPGGCQSEAECKAYCEQEAHREECRQFFEAEGAMERSEEEKRPSGEKEIPPEGGPGGCQTMDECANYCSQEANQDECMRWREEHK